MSTAAKLWVLVGAVAAAGLAFMIVRELPAMRRELKLLRM